MKAFQDIIAANYSPSKQDALTDWADEIQRLQTPLDESPTDETESLLAIIDRIARIARGR